MDARQSLTVAAPDVVRPIALALEGGGALGAFTWGVLDRLLDIPQLRFAVVSGTSAGAMNGAMLVQGLTRGGPEDAKRLLETLWQRIAIASGSFPGPAGRWLQLAAGSMVPMFDAVRTSGSPMGAGVGAFGLGLLRGILRELLHPPLFGEPGAPELIVAATDVRTGAAHLFRRGDVTIEALLASACLPQLFPAVEIGGDAYWDGGYSSNPPVRPLIEAGGPADVLVIRTMPVERHGLPYSATAVKDRVNEITFGSPLRAELRSLALAHASLAGLSDLPPALVRLRDARLHMIAPAPDEAEAASDALYPSWPNLTEQRRRGHLAAERWIAAHLAAVGQRSTIDLQFYAGSDAGPVRVPTAPDHLLEGTVNAT